MYCIAQKKGSFFYLVLNITKVPLAPSLSQTMCQHVLCYISSISFIWCQPLFSVYFQWCMQGLYTTLQTVVLELFGQAQETFWYLFEARLENWCFYPLVCPLLVTYELTLLWHLYYTSICIMFRCPNVFSLYFQYDAFLFISFAASCFSCSLYVQRHAALCL